MGRQYKQLVVLADKLPKSIRNKKIDFISELVPEMKGVELVYTSLLPGPELEVAKLAKKLNVPYVAVIPFKEYPKHWPQSLKNEYSHFLKKSISTVYVDRQLNYISVSNLPDVHGYEKIRFQIKWIFDKINLFEDPTKILSYSRTDYTLKRNVINSSLYQVEQDRYLMIEKIFNFPHSLPFTDELPF